MPKRKTMSKKSFLQELHGNFFDQTKSERLFWTITGIILIVFGYWLSLPWYISWLTALVVYLGALLLDVNKETVITTATLFFVIASFALQREDFDLRNRPYLQILAASSAHWLRNSSLFWFSFFNSFLFFFCWSSAVAIIDFN